MYALKAMMPTSTLTVALLWGIITPRRRDDDANYAFDSFKALWGYAIASRPDWRLRVQRADGARRSFDAGLTDSGAILSSLIGPPSQDHAAQDWRTFHAHRNPGWMTSPEIAGASLCEIVAFTLSPYSNCAFLEVPVASIIRQVCAILNEVGAAIGSAKMPASQMYKNKACFEEAEERRKQLCAHFLLHENEALPYTRVIKLVCFTRFLHSSLMNFALSFLSVRFCVQSLRKITESPFARRLRTLAFPPP